MRQFLMVALAAAAALLGTALPTLADRNPPTIPAHRHYVVTAQGKWSEVGPRLCDNPRLQNAFNQFHLNVHTVPAGYEQGPSAPGLHNGFGADLMARGCSFAPPS
jgi:hypothetical protein